MKTLTREIKMSNIPTNDGYDAIVNPYYDKDIKELQAKLDVAIEALNYYTHDYSEMRRCVAKEALKEIGHG